MVLSECNLEREILKMAARIFRFSCKEREKYIIFIKFVDVITD